MGIKWLLDFYRMFDVIQCGTNSPPPSPLPPETKWNRTAFWFSLLIVFVQRNFRVKRGSNDTIFIPPYNTHSTFISVCQQFLLFYFLFLKSLLSSINSSLIRNIGLANEQSSNKFALRSLTVSVLCLAVACPTTHTHNAVDRSNKTLHKYFCWNFFSESGLCCFFLFSSSLFSPIKTNDVNNQ